MSAPSAASANVTGTTTVRLCPMRPKTGWLPTCTRTYRSPAGPPRSPGAPLPLSLIRCPSATPAGILAWMVRELIARPLPEHAAHGSSTTIPRPRQVAHGSENANAPWSRLDWPVPWQSGHTFGMVPALAPVPRQTLQGPSSVSRSVTVEPSIASLNDSEASVSTSAPRRGRACVVVVRPPLLPNMPSRSPSRLPAEPVEPNRSRGSKPPNPPLWPPPGILTPPDPNRDLASSYSWRRLASDRTLYASDISLNRSSDAESPLLASGWYLRASLR